ncbi:hypothetical protein FRC08_011115 [Ceratobasidium sp. 394]|nr:hypothetical protein FRC08_011115 [Ceratobasidium sp. 394]
MSSSVKKESPEPGTMPMKPEPLDEAAMAPEDATNTSSELQESPCSNSPPQIARRPRNPFILFRTWYIKQGHLKQVTSSGSELRSAHFLVFMIPWLIFSSKITGKLWKAMHEDDRKFWAEQSKREREASQGRTYAPAAPRPRGSRSRKKASMSSGARYDPMAVRAPDPIDERMDNIVQLIISGKTGEEIGGKLRNDGTASASPPLTGIPPQAPPVSLLDFCSLARSVLKYPRSKLPLLAPVPRSARASVSLDALELQSHLSSNLLEHESLSNSLSPQTSLCDLPNTPEHHMSGYSTPLEQAPDIRTRTLSQWGDQAFPLNGAPDFSFGAPSHRGRSDSMDTESWSMAGTPDVGAPAHYPAPVGEKEAPQPVYPQGWEYCNVSSPSYGLNWLPTGYGTPNYPSQNLAPSTSTWRGPELVSAYDVPGHGPIAHTGDLAWPPEWVNDSY